MSDTKVHEKSPFAGCAIFITALLVMVFLIGFSVFVLFRQANEIAKFTSEQPAKIETDSLENKEPELNQLAEKIEAFRLGVESEQSATLALSVAEINLAIAAFEPLKDFRGMLRVASISPEAMALDISFELNGKPRLAKEGEVGWIASDSSYLNGTMLTELGLQDGELVLRLKDIQVPGKKVVPEFISQMSPYRIAERYIAKPGIGEIMPKLTAAKLQDGSIRFEKIIGQAPKDTVTNQQVDEGSKKLFTFFAIAVCVFLVFVAGVLCLAFFLKKRKGTNHES